MFYIIYLFILYYLLIHYFYFYVIPDNEICNKKCTIYSYTYDIDRFTVFVMIEHNPSFTDVEGIYLFTSGVPDQPADQCVAYVEEALKGRGCKLHTILFNVDDYDSNGAIAGRWSNITTTADIFRTLAHVTEGRFHWFRETGMFTLLYLAMRSSLALNLEPRWAWYHLYSQVLGLNLDIQSIVYYLQTPWSMNPHHCPSSLLSLLHQGTPSPMCHVPIYNVKVELLPFYHVLGHSWIWSCW